MKPPSAKGLLAAALAHVWLLLRIFGLDGGDSQLRKSVANMVYGVICFGHLFSVLSGGGAVLQVTNDVLLKVQNVQPANGILDLGATGALSVRLGFNKALRTTAENLALISVRDAAGRALAFTADASAGAAEDGDADVGGNQLVITLEPDTLLAVSDTVRVTAGAGFAAVPAELASA